jgi:hypothetical protein
VTEGSLTRLADLKKEWSARRAELQDIRAESIDAINAWAREQNVPHVLETGD